jgi:hypothetical protein
MTHVEVDSLSNAWCGADIGTVHVEVERRYDNYFYKMQVGSNES